jgi:hypothetical protein
MTKGLGEMLESFSAFVAGASIYIGTFIFSWNWDYRLIFLIFLCTVGGNEAISTRGCIRHSNHLAMNDLILTPWLGTPGVATVWIAKIVVFAVLSAYLAAFVPNIFSVRRNAARA